MALTNTFIEDWKEFQYRKLQPMFPNLSKSQIMDVLQKDVDKNFQDRDSMIHNDYNDDMEILK